MTRAIVDTDNLYSDLRSYARSRKLSYDNYEDIVAIIRGSIIEEESNEKTTGRATKLTDTISSFVNDLSNKVDTEKIQERLAPISEKARTSVQTTLENILEKRRKLDEDIEANIDDIYRRIDEFFDDECDCDECPDTEEDELFTLEEAATFCVKVRDDYARTILWEGHYIIDLISRFIKNPDLTHVDAARIMNIDENLPESKYVASVSIHRNAIDTAYEALNNLTSVKSLDIITNVLTDGDIDKALDLLEGEDNDIILEALHDISHDFEVDLDHLYDADSHKKVTIIEALNDM